VAIWRFEVIFCRGLWTRCMVATRPNHLQHQLCRFYFYSVGRLVVIRDQDQDRPLPLLDSLFLLVLLVPLVRLSPCLSSCDPDNPSPPAIILSLTQHENRPGQPPRFEPWSWEAISRNIERERKLSDNPFTSGDSEYHNVAELTMLSRS
jgi:hypothetical protein